VTRRSKSPEKQELNSPEGNSPVNFFSTSTPQDSEMKKKRKSSLFKDSEHIQRIRSFFQQNNHSPKSPKASSPKNEKSPMSPKSSNTHSDEASESSSYKRKSIFLTAMSFFQGNTTPRSGRNSLENSPFLFEFDDYLPSNESFNFFIFNTKVLCKKFPLEFCISDEICSEYF
jgi:hypothetical protein